MQVLRNNRKDLLQLTDTEKQKNNQRKDIGKTDKVEEETIELPKTSASNSDESNSSSSSSDSSSSGSSSGSDSSDDEEDETGCGTDIMQLDTSQNDKIAHPLNKNDGEDEIPGTQSSNFPTNRGRFPSTSNELLPNNNDYSSTASNSSSDSSDSDSSSSGGSRSSSSRAATVATMKEKTIMVEKMTRVPPLQNLLLMLPQQA